MKRMGREEEKGGGEGRMGKEEEEKGGWAGRMGREDGQGKAVISTAIPSAVTVSSPRGIPAIFSHREKSTLTPEESSVMGLNPAPKALIGRAFKAEGEDEETMR